MARNIFNSIALNKVRSNFFDLSHDVKMSFDMGCLIPTCVMDVVPGDKVTCSTENMLRFAALIAPVMHRIHVTTHYYFVPYRLLWPDWEDWITGESEVSWPYVTGLDTLTNGSLGDYLGFNPTGEDTFQASAFSLAAYVNIYDNYYRDQNLIAERFLPLEPGNNDDNYQGYLLGQPFKRAWNHDYYTSSLPNSQKGDEVQIPLGEFQNVDVILDDQGAPTLGHLIRNRSTGTPITAQDLVTNSGGEFSADTAGVTMFDPNGHLKADMSDLDLDAASINTLRRAFRLQEWLERNMRGGTRYIEQILSHFGVRSKDARLNRPEYIGGDKQNMIISEVLSTADTISGSEGAPLGNLAGHGISVGGGNKYKYRATEHGLIMGLINVQPVTAYMQGIPRMYTKSDRLDYFWPSFEHIGEQEVKVKEIWAAGTDAEGEETFGYVPRYSEYKFMPNRVAGEFKGTQLNFWHLARIFSAKPVLNQSFVEADPSKRIFATQTGHQVYAHIYNRIKAVRKMAKFGNPSF